MLERFKDGYRGWSREYRLYNRILPTAFLCGILLFLLYFVTLAAPLGAPAGVYLKVSKGETPAQVAAALEQKNIIRSQGIFLFFSRLFGASKAEVAGEYFFPSAENVITIARRIAHGDYEVVPVKVTIPEGATSKQIGELLDQKLPDFDADTFVSLAKPKEGYLFPDTYFFLPGEDPQEILTALQKNFSNHIETPQMLQLLATFGKPESDVVTMASLLEKEAPGTQDRRIIAGILWHRIALGMPLQVDAVFPYIIGVNSLQLTRQDLQTNSPYNTYTHKGLPPGPIANPGLDAIVDAMTPVKTNYLYYLSDLHGNFHYCATYSCQQANARKYLGN